MSAEKRRKSRVQGGWASPSPKDVPNKQKPTEKKSSNHTPQLLVSHHDENSPSLHRGKTPLPVGPAWLGKNIDQLAAKTKFTFEEPEEEIKLKPADLVIVKPGVYDISTEPSGLSRHVLRYFPQFVELSQSESIFAALYDEIPWKQRYDIHNGVKAIQPRLTQWYSELPYTYSGLTVEANTSEWPKPLKELKQQLAEVTGIEFNSLAANLYRDGHDSIGWHSDDEPIMGKTPTIASLSFGDERVFELRKKPYPLQSGEQDYTYSQVIRLTLGSGSLLIMEGWTQTDWQHRVPKEYHDRGPRINVTFRVARPTLD
ncbi:unnamed protein product [Lymnaea stagnalis]|uniref:Fe2OG dioxygenase domain-containing protein n=1 Tax=Lymnaea stagnalis TaxID=6523 RepID=A0AAV2HG31_LYMST